MTTTENESTESDALSMFFNDDFVPHAYLDALFDSTLSSSSSKTPLNRYQIRSKLDSVGTLQLLQSKCSSLLAHLDYYTKELTGDLENRIKKLENSSAVISFENTLEEEGNSNTTRLEYYLENLTSHINLLHDDIATYNKEITEIETLDNDQDVLHKLTNLKQIKLRMLLVLKIFETAKLVATTSQLEDNDDNMVARTSSKQLQKISVDVETFTKSIYLLEGAIDEELKTKDDEVKHIMKKIDNLISLLPLFKNLPRFYNVYSLFVSNIKEKRDNFKIE